MYALYKKSPHAGGYRYQFIEHVSLFGSNKGYIPWLLTETLPDASEPVQWHLNIDAALRTVDQAGCALIINLKPDAKTANLSLYEVIDAFGCSEGGWTPLMLHLAGLFVDDSPTDFDEADFSRSPSETDDPIFSMMYLNGTLRNGQLDGRWTPPGPSSTNSVLLWPAALEYFSQNAKAIIDSRERG